MWIWWPRKISNKGLWRQTGQGLIDQERRKRAWRWIGHTLRRPDGHVVERALEWNPQGKQKRGRPQHTWRRTRIAELERKHLTWNKVKGTAQNRVRWRILVEDLCSTRNKEDYVSILHYYNKYCTQNYRKEKQLFTCKKTEC